jgi:hypothetical protein
MSPTGWQRLGDPAPTELSAARIQLHNAAQIVQSLGRSLLIERDDDSHATLSWLPELGVLAGESSDGRRLALRPDDLTLLDLDAETLGVDATFPLDGRTIDEAVDWLRSRLGRNSAAHTMEVPYDIGDVAFGDDQKFDLEATPGLAELGRWFADAHLLLSAIVDRDERASPVRCWPHHFDIATLLTIGPGADPESSRTVGMGMTPGDSSYAEPYIYVTPWPYPDQPTPAPLAGGGEWHQEGWFGAVLPGSTLATDATAEAQASRLTAFLESAIDQCIALQES